MLLTAITMIDKFFKYYEKLDIVINNNITSNKVAVIIEPRNHKYLVGVIKQTMDKLGNTWNLRIFGSDKNEANIKKNIKGTYTFVNMRIDDFVSPDAYSLFMQSKQFWNKIAEEHILIFQTDSFILSNNYGIPLQYGFIGAPYFYGYNIHSDDRIDINAPVKGGYNINGGFSYRNKNVMLDCLNKVENADIINYRKKNGLNIDYFIDRVIIPEDVFFVNAMSVLNYPMPVGTMPDHTECTVFCLNQFQEHSINMNNELINNGTKPFGIHPFDKFNKDVIDRLCIDALLQTLQSKIKILCGSFQDEMPEQKMAIRYLSGNEKVLEIGSNIGRNSMIISNLLTDSANLVTLETDPNIVPILHEHKQINNLNFHIEHAALSLRKLVQKGWDTMPSDTVPDGFTSVNIISYAELQKKYNIKFDTLAVDCEGALYYILLDMPEILENIKLIMMENDYYNELHKKYVDQVLYAHGFNVVYTEPLVGHEGLFPHTQQDFYQVWKKPE
jgi:FkbM family methyltransferase